MATYVWEVLILPDLDWVGRHHRFWGLPSRVRDSTAARLPPDVLLQGKFTGRRVERGEVIPLPDKVRWKQTRLSDRYPYPVLKRKSTPVLQRNDEVEKRYKQSRLC